MALLKAAALLADGCWRHAAGRDYVLRRVLRRGVRYGQDTLKAPAGFFHGLVDSVVASMGHFYPELVKARDHIVDVIRYSGLKHHIFMIKGWAQSTYAIASDDSSQPTALPTVCIMCMSPQNNLFEAAVEIRCL